MAEDTRSPEDQAQRERALSVTESFIVQAPAGSGKTELLTRRYLALLAVCQRPEEILSLTFTRKAAGEMRQRIIKALELARDPEPPEQDYQRQTWELGRAAWARNQEQGWELGENPARLQIMTIDSLSALLARQMPMLSRRGRQPAHHGATPRLLSACGASRVALARYRRTDRAESRNAVAAPR